MGLGGQKYMMKTPFFQNLFYCLEKVLGCTIDNPEEPLTLGIPGIPGQSRHGNLMKILSTLFVKIVPRTCITGF